MSEIFRIELERTIDYWKFITMGIQPTRFGAMISRTVWKVRPANFTVTLVTALAALIRSQALIESGDVFQRQSIYANTCILRHKIEGFAESMCFPS